MSRLSIRTVERNKLPYGRFQFEITLVRKSPYARYSESNAGQIEAMRGILNDTCGGRYKFRHIKNSMDKKVYTHLYMMNAMDVAMLKLVHADKLFKIYRIRLAETCESLLDHDRIVA